MMHTTNPLVAQSLIPVGPIFIPVPGLPGGIPVGPIDIPFPFFPPGPGTPPFDPRDPFPPFIPGPVVPAPPSPTGQACPAGTRCSGVFSNQGLCIGSCVPIGAAPPRAPQAAPRNGGCPGLGVTDRLVCPGGCHANKSDYFLRSGAFVPKGSRCVRNRRRNPLNPRAMDRAAGRLRAAKKAGDFLSGVKIPKRRKR